MSDNSIEILGQKFSYPDTWQGAVSVFVVCACIAFLAHTLTPAQLDAIAGFARTDDKAVEAKLSEINQKLVEENKYLTQQINDLANLQRPSIEKLQEVADDVAKRQGVLAPDFEELVKIAKQRLDNVNDQLDSAKDGTRQQLLAAERVQMQQQLSEYQQQKQRHVRE